MISPMMALMTVRLRLLLPVGLALLVVSAYPAEPKRPVAILPGQQPDGSILLPNQWSLRPVGRQVPMGDFPVNIAIHPAGRHAAVLHCGHGQHEVVIVDVTSAKIVSTVAFSEAFYGLAFSTDGARLFCSGASDEVVRTFKFAEGYLTEPGEIPLRPVRERGIPAGLALSRDGTKLWTANVLGHRVSEIALETPPRVTDVAFSKDIIPSTPGITPPSDPDLAAATKRDEARLAATAADDPFPYTCVVDEARHRLYTSLWGRGGVWVVDLATHKTVAVWPVEEHPNEMILAPGGNVLFVANANRNTVSVIDLESGRTLETLSSALHPGSPPGSTPNSLAVSPDGTLLFVANACNNNLAVFDVSKPGASSSLGFIPVGWYPTSVRVTPDGKHLLVANGKGLTSRANRHGPQPGLRDPQGTVREYIGGLLRGTLSIIDLPDREKFATQLVAYTARARKCTPLETDQEASAKSKPGKPIPAWVGGSSPIKHCIYILKENRTYDQVLGDMPQGNGDPGLCLFPESVTPNHHQLARDFVLLDNFYVESEVSADGHEWSMAAYATDFVEKTWPISYGHNQRGKYSYPSEGNFRIAVPASGYLWDRAIEANVTFRVYGEFIANGKTVADPSKATRLSLEGNFDSGFRGWDMDYPDVKRAERFIAEFQRLEREGTLPSLQILRLPNDHTYGTSAGKPTPRAMVADNDLALGMIVEAVSRSKSWARTAIFIVEDDAQNGPDHVDAHRTIAFAISPYVRRGKVDSTLYSTCSMLRTIELILGMKPMTQFDAAAVPMFNAFQPKPNLAPYHARPVTVDRTEKNSKLAWGADLSEKMDFAKEDAADDLLLNEVIWRAVRGPESPMPAPVRAAFIFSKADED